MKKLFYVSLAVFIAIVFIVSCGPKTSKDIDVEKLSSACECVDAALIVVNEMLDLEKELEKLYDNDGSEERMDEIEDIDAYELMELLDEIGEKGVSLGYDDDEFEKCKNFKELERKMDKLYDVW